MKLFKTILILVTAMLFYACEDILDTKLDNVYGDASTWSIPQKAEGVLMNAYNAIPQMHDHFNTNFLDVATDNAVTNNFSANIYSLATSGMSVTDQSPVGNWGTAYTQINYINLFLENGLNDSIQYNTNPDVSDNIKSRLKGEAFFLRAWWLSELLRVYGGVTDDGEALGVPVFTSSLEADNNITSDITRNTYEECILQIFADCDSAINYLPLVYDKSSGAFSTANIGRATKKAALALKSRMATYAASPAYQPSNITDNEVKAKWERAALMSQQAITDGQLGGYTALSQANMVGAALSKTPDEFIFRNYFNNNGLETRNLPPAFYGGGRTNPSQNLVDAYYSKNGYPITDERSAYNPQDPYNYRDDRMALTIYTNGMNIETGGRPLEIFHDVVNDKPGMDAPGYFHNNTRTGYYLKKWMSMKMNMLNLSVGNKQNDFHMYPLLRRSEIYLNYAEASNQAVGPDGIVPGCDFSALNIINTIRNTAGGIVLEDYAIEVAAQGKEAFNNLILNERRLELAFENHRYFDLRRWKMPLNEAIYGAKIEKDELGLVFSGTNPSAERIVVEKRGFNNERDFYTPIPYSELVKSPKMKNNKGW